MRTIALLLTLFTVVALPVWADDPFCAPAKPPAKPAPPDEPCPACEPKECDKCTKSPVYVGAGTFTDAQTDLAISTPSFGINVDRRYDSARLVDGPMGIGWSSSLTPRLHYAVYAATPTTSEYRAYVVMPHGATYEFVKTTGGNFSPPFGRNDVLTQNVDQTFTLWQLESGTVLQFAATGALVSITDEFGNALQYTYDANGRVERISDTAGSGRFVDVTWNTTTGRISAVTDSAGRTVRYTHDALGKLEGVVDAVTPLGQQSSRYTYVQGRFSPLLSEVRDRWYRLILSVNWDSSDRVSSYTEGEYPANDPAPSGEKYIYSYFPNGGPFSTEAYTLKVSSLGQKNYKYVPGTGLVTNDGTDYDDNGRVIATYDDLGRKTAYVYDGLGRLLHERIYDAQNNLELQWNYTYDSVFAFKVTSRKSSAPHLWSGVRYEYWPVGSVAPGALKTVYRIRTDGVTEDWEAAYTYDSHGRVKSAQHGLGMPVISYDYNASGDLISVKAGATAPPTTYVHDALGRVTDVTDQAGKTTTYTYDDADRVLTATLPKPSTSSTLVFTSTFVYDQYDALSGLTFNRTTDPNGRVTSTGYDALGRLVKGVDALANETTYAYRYNLLRSITDANGNRTDYAHDAQRHLESTTFPDGNVEHYTYSASGRLASRTDRRGILCNYTYDRYGRLYGIAYPNQHWPSGQFKAISYHYTGQKLMSIMDNVQSAVPTTYQYTYDPMFRVLTEGPAGGTGIEYDYRYDGSPLLESYTTKPWPTNNDRATTVYFGYDALARVNRLSLDIAIPEVEISYNSRGQYDAITFRNGMVRNYDYDDQGRLTMIDNAHPIAGTVAKFAYAYDYDWTTSTYTALGQRHRVDVTAPNIYANQVEGLYKYRYDGNYQLLQVDGPSSTWEKWTYDGIGNRLTRQTNTSGVQTYSYYKYNGNPLNSSRLLPSTYDGSGNRLDNGAVWDETSRLTTYNGVTYKYDHADRRIMNGTRTYAYRDADLVRERDTTGAGILNDYIFGPGIDEPLVRIDKNGAKHYFVTDALGTIVAAVAADGTISEGKRYDVWGNDKTGVGTPATFGFTGREPGGPGNYYRARYYDSTSGRFISEDPLGFGASINFYTYVDNLPTMMVDPLGLEKKTKQDYVNCYMSKSACAAVVWCQNKAMKATKAKFKVQKDGTASNAYLHCYWSCCIASLVGAETAEAFTDGHEEDPDALYCNKLMDKHNNKQGVKGATAKKDCNTHCSSAPLQNAPDKNKCIPCKYME